MANKVLTMKLLQERYGVCRLDKNHGSIPEWAMDGEFSSITRTEDELSVVCPDVNIPEGVTRESGWKILKVEGPLDFGLVGILSAISGVLAAEKISIFALSTYDTDYILVKETNLDRAINALVNANYKIEQ